MGEESRDIIMAELRKDVLITSLERGLRYDGRKPGDFRSIEVQKGPIQTAEGSALANIGGTKVLVSLKFAIATPFPDRPDEGVLISNAELLPTASSGFETGPPGEECIELARVVDRAVRSADCIDLKSLYVEKDKVLAAFIDIYVLDHKGNYTDAATLAATAAMLDAKVPKVEDGKVIYGEYQGPLNPRSLPISVTFGKVGNHWLVDLSRDEEVAVDTELTIATTDEHVCAIQKSKGRLSKKELMDNIDIAFKTGEYIRSILKNLD
jgi:exosome complex component RRP42